MIAAGLREFVAPEATVIRGLTVDGEPAVVGKDLCAALGIANHNDALGDLREDERGGSVIPTPSGRQSVTVVFEPGIYRLIFRSRKPEAEAFKRWVFHEVLPELRRTGAYRVARGAAPEGKVTLTTWVESLGVDLEEHALEAKVLFAYAKRAAEEAGYAKRTVDEESGLIEYPAAVLRYAQGMMMRKSRAEGAGKAPTGTAGLEVVESEEVQG